MLSDYTEERLWELQLYIAVMNSALSALTNDSHSFQTGLSVGHISMVADLFDFDLFCYSGSR